jgi:hypothetical protein
VSRLPANADETDADASLRWPAAAANTLGTIEQRCARDQARSFSEKLLRKT